MESQIKRLQIHLGKDRVLKDRGKTREFLYIEIDRNNLSIVGLSQSRLKEKLLVNTDMSASKPTATPMDSGYDSIPNEEPLTEDRAYGFKSIIGIVLYLAVKKDQI